MAYISERKLKNTKYYVLVEKVEGKLHQTYLGTKTPIAKARGWTKLSPEIIEWLKQRARQKTKSIKLSPDQKGKYRTIVIDPPWPMQRIDMQARTPEMVFDYPTMTISQIKNDRKLNPIRQYINKSGSFVFLWTTQKFLTAAFSCFDTWKIKYLFTMVWIKNAGMQPVKLPQFNCEFVLVGRRGNIDFMTTKNFRCAFNGNRRDHSRKPDEFYEIIKMVSPAPRIDMYSRCLHDGFDQFGNEVDKFNVNN